MSKENVEIVKCYVEMWSRGDVEGALAFTHPDVLIHEPPSLPYGGTHRGVGAVRMMLQNIAEQWEVAGQVKIETLDGGENTVFNCIQFPARSRKTGKEILIDVIEKNTLRDGKVVENKVYYWDTHACLQALGLDGK